MSLVHNLIRLHRNDGDGLVVTGTVGLLEREGALHQRVVQLERDGQSRVHVEGAVVLLVHIDANRQEPVIAPL